MKRVVPPVLAVVVLLGIGWLVFQRLAARPEADTLYGNVEIRQVRDPIQANARGAAWIAAVALGKIAFADIPHMVRFKQCYEPNPANRGLYDERFEIFKQIYRQMNGVYKRLNRA